MPEQHTVEQGETCAHIAARFGVPEAEVWNDPANQALKDQRKNPNILFPGDVLEIPDIEQEQSSGQTSKRHRFRVHGVPLKLRLELRDESGEPIPDCACQLALGGGELVDVQTDGDGRIEADLPLSVTEGELHTPEGKVELKIGHLDPVDELSGWRERLNNLGYNAGSSDDPDCPQRRYALEEFQCDHDLQVDAICGPKTQAKLVEVHGC